MQGSRQPLLLGRKVPDRQSRHPLLWRRSPGTRALVACACNIPGTETGNANVSQCECEFDEGVRCRVFEWGWNVRTLFSFLFPSQKQERERARERGTGKRASKVWVEAAASAAAGGRANRGRDTLVGVRDKDLRSDASDSGFRGRF